MDALERMLADHGHLAVFLLVFADQAGLPFPGEFLLIGAGALAATGTMSLPVTFALGVVASVLADLLWYELGRRRGAGILAFLCRVSLEPDSCVRRTEAGFEGRGPAVLVIAKFVPGLSTVGPPLAGMLGTSRARFLLLDGAGSALWVGAFLGLGWIFGDQVERATAVVAGVGTPLAAVVGAVVAVHVGGKFWSRQRTLRRLRGARVTAAEVRRRLDAGEPTFIVDLRSPLDFALDPRLPPGAVHIPAEDLPARAAEIPRDRDVVLYCT